MIESILQAANLKQAWQRVRQNKGSAGIDGITLEDYPDWARVHWANIRRGLEQGYYCPQPVRRVEIPKPDGGIRLLGVPTVNDRVIQQAIVQVLQPLIDPTFSEHSYGFRPQRSAHMALRAIQGMIKRGYVYAVDIDLSKFFDNVDHDILMHRLGKRVTDKRLMTLTGKYLRAGVNINGQLEPTLKGVPQGGPLSPLLANILLDDLDRYLESRKYPFARYADDFVIGAKSEAEGLRIKQEVENFLQTLKLPVNKEKSQVVPMMGLCFLGYQFRKYRLIWSAKSLRNFKHRIRQLTGRSWGVSWSYRYHKLREYVTGWMNYFSLVIFDPVERLDYWIRRRIRMCYLKQWRKPRTCIRNLIRLGVPELLAIGIGMSSKGCYRRAKTKAAQMGMSNQWLKEQGLVSLKEQWIKCRY